MIKSKKLWIDRNQSIDNTNEMEETYLFPITTKILKNRGIYHTEDMISFLNPDYSGLHDPFLLKDMDKAVNRVLSALRNNEKITIYGDYDVDGMTSTSILYLFLKENGADVDYYIPNRMEEGYGLNIDALDKIKITGADLIITVDTGITAVKEVSLAKEMGMDIIITDHHECQSEIPKAYGVIDPKQKDCSYPFKLLAGVGVAFKLIQGLSKKLNVEDTVWKYIDIVSVGTVADIVPLTDENRIFVKKGFEKIPNTKNVGLNALLRISGYKGGAISTGLIGFGIAPRLNASGRIGDAKRGVELFITHDEAKAKILANELNDENKNRQDMEQEILIQAIDWIEKELDINKTKIIVIAGENWHQGVIGIVASKIVDKYYRPTIILTVENGIAKGSARSVDGFNIFEALCESGQFLTKFGGHEMAAGLTMPVENINDFRDFINDYANNNMNEETLIPKLYLDDHIHISEISLELISELKKMEPFGVGNPQPVFSLQGKINNVRSIGKENQHLKLDFEDSNQFLDAIGFGFGEYANRLSPYQSISVAGSLEINEWNNIIKPQLFIKDLKSTLEDELTYNYYISLYHLFLTLDDEWTSLDFHWVNKISFNDIWDVDHTIILVHRLDNLIELCRYAHNHEYLFNKKPKICYTVNCALKTKFDIVVNPIISKIDFNPYKRIIIYDSIWNNNNYNLLYNKKNILFKIEETEYNKNDTAQLILERKDFVVLYKYLRLLSHLNQNTIGFDTLINECNKSINTNGFKILLLLDVFMELGLINYSHKDDIINFQIISNNKISLENSKIFQKIIKLND